jgi:hypothetical protein
MRPAANPAANPGVCLGRLPRRHTATVLGFCRFRPASPATRSATAPFRNAAGGKVDCAACHHVALLRPGAVEGRPGPGAR